MERVLRNSGFSKILLENTFVSLHKVSDLQVDNREFYFKVIHHSKLKESH